MELTINLTDKAARQIPARLATLRDRTRQGPDTLWLIGVLDELAQALPPFFDVGDTVYVSGDSVEPGDGGDTFIVESLVNNGSHAVVCTVDRTGFRLVAVVDMTLALTPE